MPIQWNPLTWLDRLIEQRMHIAGQAMVGMAKVFAAEDTGYMKAHIYYTYAPDTKTLTLHSDAHYSIYQEFGTFQMPPHPFMRPALNAVGPSFLTGKLSGVSTQMMVGTSLDPFHTPLKIQPHIRPRIAAANLTHNVGVTSRTRLTAIHMDRSNEPRRVRVGKEQKSRVLMSSLSKLNRIRKAWN
jgi:hypothetical protein